MEVADNKKYYYLKLKDNFFESESMILLESMRDGYLYSNILLKLYLKSLKDEGRLQYNNRIPYNAQMLASITRHQVGVVEKALQTFQELGLIELLDSGVIYMMDIQKFIGKSSTEADRKKDYRMRIEVEKGQMSHYIGGQMSEESGQTTDNFPPEIRDKRLENKDINNLCAAESAQDTRKDDFEQIYDIYPKKRGKAKAYEYYRTFVSKPGRLLNGQRYRLTPRDIYIAVQNYVNEKQQEGTDIEFYKNFDTFMNKTILDYLEESVA